MNELERGIDRKYAWIQIAYNLLFILFWYFANDGLAFWDDYSYLNLARQINDGFFEVTTNHFTSRVGLIYPVAWIIRWLGIDAYSITIFPFVCGLLILNLLMYHGKRYNIWIGVIGGLFLVCDYHFLQFVTHLFPEVPFAACIFLALFSYDIVNRREGDHRFLALLTALSLFVAFLIKTTVFLLVPLFLFLFFNDRLRRKKHYSYWLITVTCLLFFFVLNLFYYYETKGDAFYRLNNISMNHEASSKTFFDKPLSETLKRLTYLPLFGFMRGGFFIPLILALPAIITLKKSDWRLNDPTKLWAIATILTLASWWFMSTNWKYYSPMPIDTRHITFIIPFMLMAGVYWWTKTKTSLFKQVERLKWPFALLLLLLAIPIYKVSKSDDRNFKDLESLYQTELIGLDAQLTESQTVYTDGLLSYGYPYFYNFKEANFNYEWWVESDLAKVDIGDYLLINQPFLNERYNDFIKLEKLKAIVQERGWNLNCSGSGRLSLCKVER